MSRSGGDDEEVEASVYYESFEQIPSPETSSSALNSEIDEGEERDEVSGVDAVLKFPMGASSYDLWTTEPVSSVKDRRSRLLRQMGLSSDPVLSRVKSAVSADTSEGEASCSNLNDLNICCVNSFSHNENGGGIVRDSMSNGVVLIKPPSGRNRNFESGMMTNTIEEGVLTMKNLENGHSPIVQELMRRENVEEGDKDQLEALGSGGNGLKSKKRGGWLKGFRNVTSTVAGQKERCSSDERDERDNSSDRAGPRSSYATDDSQVIVFHGPERVRVRPNGKSSKELSALYKSQEICAHSGSIWSIKFSLDGMYLASAGEDCVIHVWQVVGSERKGDLLTDDISLNSHFWENGSSLTSSPNLDNPWDKRRRNRSSLARKSLCIENIYVPETVFALSEKPSCSFQGHTDDILDLSWSKSQYLLSSSMDKTVRLWHLSSQSCLKIFSHNDYVTCIHFNPADDRYFISGSLDAKVRIWSIPDHQVVDWTDLHEMVTAACYTPDGQGAWVGSYKGSCRLYSTTENKLVQNRQINLQNKKKKSHQKKITGFQFTPGGQSEVLVTSADSRVRVIDGDALVHKYKGFRNTQTQISASITRNGKYIVSASEDSNVYVWRHEADSRSRRSKTVTVTQIYENFHCQDVSVAIPWSGLDDLLCLNGVQDQNAQSGEVITGDKSPTNVNRTIANEPSTSSAGSTGKIFGMTGNSNDKRRTSSTSNIPYQSTDLSRDFSNGLLLNKSAWGMVIITGGLRGELKTFQNFGVPIRN